MRRANGVLRGVGTGIFAVVSISCGGSAEAGGADEAEVAVDTRRVINVEVRVVEPEDFIELIHLTGVVLAERDVVLAAEEAGVIREILVEKGTSVRAGQGILKIDDRILRAQVDEARADATLAEETWERRRRLFEVDQVGSELALLGARAASDQAKARLTVMEERLARTVVRAPFPGIFDERLVELGEMVSPGSAVARIVQLDPVKVVAGVPERFAPDIAAGAMATVSFDVIEGGTFEGDITYVGSTVNANNRTFRVELHMTNPGGVIKPQMVANLEIVRRTVHDALVVPQEALVRVEDGYVVFIVEGEGEDAVAVVRPVVVGPRQRNLVVIEEGLNRGERLIVVGQQRVADSDRVNVVTRSGG